jgi:ergothioneine biosynthesis protein EgtB
MTAGSEMSGPASALRSTARFVEVRAATERLAAPLSPEDCSAQSMPLASPIRWHLAHTSWFFETFLLARAVPGYRPFHPQFAYLFNSYYNAIGERVPQSERGRITRPDLEEVLAYRRHVDRGVAELLERPGPAAGPEIGSMFELGLNHEQQHQELMLTDLKHLLSLNPLRPAFRESRRTAAPEPGPARFLRFDGGLHEIGCSGPGFAFDNEGPRHSVFTQPFELASRPVTNGEFLEFVEAGVYRDPSVWLSDGWDWVVAEGIRAPLYWAREERGWRNFTLAGERELDPAEPVAHVSFYEADAYARWRGARLPREDEWELAARPRCVEGNFVESGALHPRPSPTTISVAGSIAGSTEPVAMFGDVWEWTQSPYVGYPGFRPAPGAFGEYNGKFMCNRIVLRGGSCASPRSHLRASYRNFFLPTARWQFSGIRLARGV